MLPSATFTTTTVKFRIRSSVASQAATRGCEESCFTSSRTMPSLSSSGGSVIGIASPPSGCAACGRSTGSRTAVVAGAGRRTNPMYAATAIATMSTATAIHTPTGRLGGAR